ncbi:MAG: tyrosine-type recombinase/integrase, partial [Nitrospira sp.]|nr:tyrosine-type recombinase/integrase [Nitrospira sp.]
MARKKSKKPQPPAVRTRGVFQRKDREGWWCQVFINGRAKTFKCTTKSQAEALHGKLRAQIRERTFFPEQFAPKQKDVTLRAWIRRVLDGNTNRGWRNEKTYGKRWSLLLGPRLLRDLKAEDLRIVQRAMRAKRLKREALRAQGKPVSGRGPADSTINRHFIFLSKVLNLAKKDGLIERNPCEGIRRFPEVRKTRFLTDDELIRLKNVMAPEHWAMVAFAIETGLRREEQFGLRWDQIDLENAVLTVPLPKGGKTRHVPLSDHAIAILRANQSFLVSAYVYPGHVGPHKPLDASTFAKKVFGKALRQAGIQGVSWHKLRHTSASRRVMAGVDLVTVKTILGHNAIETTMRYAHLAPGHVRAAINKGTLDPTLTSTQTNPPERGEEKGGRMQPIDLLVRPAG